jgi:hypothetical protein
MRLTGQSSSYKKIPFYLSIELFIICHSFGQRGIAMLACILAATYEFAMTVMHNTKTE